MPSLNMNGPYKLTTEKVNDVIARISPGNYGLGNVQDTTFYVYYVGRSDDDINERLKQWVGENPSRYSHFKFSYATSPKAAFEKECRNYHDFGGSEQLDNDYHPSRPEGASWQCPICDIFN